MSHDDLYPCPACGFETFEEVTGSFATCPVCGWKDDHTQLLYSGGPGENELTLAQHQEKVLTEFSANLQEANGFKKNQAWRPLTEDEITTQTHGDAMPFFTESWEDDVEYYWLEN